MPIIPPVPVNPSGGSSTSSGSSSGPPLLYWGLGIMPAGTGTFTTGGGLDWSAQFGDTGLGPYALQTAAGEISVPAISSGVSVSMLIEAANTTDFSVWVEASAGSVIQAYVNGVVTELNAAGEFVVSLLQGPNLIKFTRDAGPMVVMGHLLVAGMAEWRTTYFPGDDPFLLDGGASGGTGSTGSAGTPGSPGSPGMP